MIVDRAVVVAWWLVGLAFCIGVWTCAIVGIVELWRAL